jgi:hypothetical protein
LLREKDWCKNWSARNVKGRPVNIDSIEAVAFCADGAILYCYGNDNYNEMRIKFKKANNDIGDWGITVWNDYPKRTKEEVIAAFEKAGM